MNDFIRTFIVFISVGIAAALVIEAARLVLEAIKLHRVQVNSEMKGDNKRLREENGYLRSCNVGITMENKVHVETINRLQKENDALEAENRMLLAGTPIVKPLRDKKIAH